MDKKNPNNAQFTPYGNKISDIIPKYNIPNNSNDARKYHSLTKFQSDSTKIKIEESRQKFFSETTLRFSATSEIRKYQSETSCDNVKSPLIDQSVQLRNTSINKVEPRKPTTELTNKLTTNAICYQSPYTNRTISNNNKMPTNQPSSRYSCSNTNMKYSSPQVSPKLISCETKPQKIFEYKRKEKLEPAEYCIFNFYEFNKIEKLQLEKRIGSKIDADKIEKTFKELKLKGKIHKNLTLKKLKTEIGKLAKEDFSKKSAIVITIMSHGLQNFRIFAKDSIFSLYDDIIEPLSKNETLHGKPKIIFIEACKGTKDPRWQTDTNSISDMLIFDATFENRVSYTHPDTGSYFTQTLCQKIKELGKFKDIHDICNAVIDDVKRKYKQIQIPTITVNLTQKYCFGDYL